MKATISIVLGGLLFAGTAFAADPQPAPSTDSGMKVGIDAKTGKLRRLTAAESAQLDAMTAKQRSAAAAAAKGKRAAKEVVAFVAPNGMIVYLDGEEHMVHTTATIDANGKVVVTHGEHAPQHAPEAGNE